jgi:hypothetical protein
VSDRADEQFPEWVCAVDALLQRQWDLDRLFPDRDPEKRNPSPTRKFPRLVYRLNREFGRNNCARAEHLNTGYIVQSTADEYRFVVQRDPPPEIETAALHAVLDWSKPALEYSHYTTPEEMQELRELRRRLARAAQNRLDALNATAPLGRLRFDQDTYTITLDGRDFTDINPKAFLLYRAIWQAGGPTTRQQLRLKVQGINNPKAVRGLVDTLPTALRKTVNSGPPGFWLVLPRLKKKALP